MDYERIIVLADQHIPFQDKPILRLINKFIQDFKPTEIVLLGDLIDFYELSPFNKIPSRRFRLQEELDQAHEYLTILRSICFDIPINYIAGNHEDRLTKYLWRQTEFWSLRDLTVERLLRLGDLDINYYPQDKDYMKGRFIFVHGNKISLHSSYSAKRNYDQLGCCGVCGHSHRFGSYYRTTKLGVDGFFENGCLCDSDKIEWTLNKVSLLNWQQGFSILYFMKRRFQIVQIPIIDGKFIFGDKIYETAPEEPEKTA